MDILERVASWFDNQELARNLMSVEFVWRQTFDAVEATDCSLTCKCNFFDGSQCLIQMPTPRMHIDFGSGTPESVQVLWL